MISGTFQRILGVQGTTFIKRCANLSTKTYHWSFKVVLPFYWSQIGSFWFVFWYWHSSKMGVFFLFRRYSAGFIHFSVFDFCYRVYKKTRNPRKIFRSSFSELLRLFIWFRTLFEAFCTIKTQLSKSCSKYSKRIYHWSLKVPFLVIKAKMILGYPIILFLAVF